MTIELTTEQLRESLMTTQEVAEWFGSTVEQIQNFANESWFIEPIKLGTFQLVWSRKDVEQFTAALGKIDPDEYRLDDDAVIRRLAFAAVQREAERRGNE